jgi:two-component system LytT family response regulator
MLLTNLDQPAHSVLTTLVKRNRVNVKTDDVDYLKGDGNYTYIHLIAGRPILCSRTLSTFEETPGFLRVHKGYLVNLVHVKRLLVISPKEAYVVLKSGPEIAVSRRRISYVVEQIRLSRES